MPKTKSHLRTGAGPDNRRIPNQHLRKRAGRCKRAWHGPGQGASDCNLVTRVPGLDAGIASAPDAIVIAPTDIGQRVEPLRKAHDAGIPLDAVAAVVIGAASPFGGSGTILDTVAGTCVIRCNIGSMAGSKVSDLTSIGQPLLRIRNLSTHFGRYRR